MKKIITIVILCVFSLSSYSQDKKTRLDWSKSTKYLSLKKFCNLDLSIQDSLFFKVLDDFKVDFNNIYGAYLNDEGYRTFGGVGSLYENKLVQPGEEKKDYTLHDLHEMYRVLKFSLRSETTEKLYGRILLETDPLYKSPRGGGPNTYVTSRLYQEDKDECIVRELDSLFIRWNEIKDNYLWEKYLLSRNKKFLDVASTLNRALEKRKNRKLENGVFKSKYVTSETKYHTVEVPYKVVGNELVPDGICIYNIVDKQYPNANGGSYKKATMDIKIYIKVVDGVAVSKKFSGIHQLWTPNKRVYDKTKGGFLTKTANTLDAKPVVAKTNDMAKIENPDIILSQSYIDEIMRLSCIDDASLPDYCSRCLRSPADLNSYIKIIEALPIRPIDTSKIR